MPARKAEGKGHGWPMPTGATTGVVPMPISEAEAERMVTEQTAPPTDHLYTGDQPGNLAMDTTVPGSATAPPSATAAGDTPPATDRDVVARVIDILSMTQGFQVRDVRPTRLATQQITLAPGVVAPLFGYEAGRRRLVVRVLGEAGSAGTGIVYVGNSADVETTGFALTAGSSGLSGSPNDQVEIFSTDEMWVGANQFNDDPVTVFVLREILA